MQQNIISKLNNKFNKLSVFSNFSGNPIGENVEEGVVEFNKNKCISSGGKNYAGSFKKEILEFNLQTESWTEIGLMKEPEETHAVSVVSFEDFKKWCN